MSYKTKPLALLIFAALAVTLSAQPQQLNYQAIVRNAAGQPVTSGTISMLFIIHDSSAAGPVVFQERDSAQPNQFGLVTVAIGAGGGNLGTVNWGLAAKYLEVETDITGGTSYVDMGTTQLLSVPYALFAANSAPGPRGPSGPIGLNGPTGATGSQGAAGMQGAIGPTGATGANGISGPTGVMGPQGVTGMTGAGVDGATGAQGPAGTPGATGATGATGPVSCNTPDFLIKSNGTSAVCSQIYDNGTYVGIATDTPTATLDVNGNVRIRGGSPGDHSVLTSTDTLGNAVWTIPPSINTANDGTLLVPQGIATTLYTQPVTLPQGVYLVTPYNCINGSSADYYVQFTAEATSGTISSGFTNRNYSQLTSFTMPPFILKVMSATAIVEFTVSQGAGVLLPITAVIAPNFHIR